MVRSLDIRSFNEASNDMFGRLVFNVSSRVALGRPRNLWNTSQFQPGFAEAVPKTVAMNASAPTFNEMQQVLIRLGVDASQIAFINTCLLGGFICVFCILATCILCHFNRRYSKLKMRSTDDEASTEFNNNAGDNTKNNGEKKGPSTDTDKSKQSLHPEVYTSSATRFSNVPVPDNAIRQRQGNFVVDNITEEVRKTCGNRSRARMHDLDWIRTTMVVCVVLGHATRINIVGGDFDRDILVDDSYWNFKNPNPASVRWISIARQLCIPILFWVSGAAQACSFAADFPYSKYCKAFKTYVLFVIVGMINNAIIWFASPGRFQQDCDPAHANDAKLACDQYGTLLHFTVTPRCGTLFPILYQMWYVLMLLAVMLLNVPLFCVIARVKKSSNTYVILQAVVASLIYICLAKACERERSEMALTIMCEFVFHAVALLEDQNRRCRKLPLRAVHYFLCLISILQIATTPFEKVMRQDFPFQLYIFVVCNRFYSLGFIMVYPRAFRPDEDAQPLMSKSWPVVLLLMLFVAPSTNYDLEGNLAYPYFNRMSDRIFYTAGSFSLALMLDRLGRWSSGDIAAMPELVHLGSLVLYLLHPFFFVIWSLVGVRNPFLLFLLCLPTTVPLAKLVSYSGMFGEYGKS